MLSMLRCANVRGDSERWKCRLAVVLSVSRCYCSHSNLIHRGQKCCYGDSFACHAQHACTTPQICGTAEAHNAPIIRDSDNVHYVDFLNSAFWLDSKLLQDSRKELQSKAVAYC